VNPIVRKGDVNPNEFQFHVAAGKLTLALADGDGTGVQAPTALATNQWIQVGGVWDGKNVQLYVNGVLQVDKAPAVAPVINKDTRPVYIGGRPSTATDASSADLFAGNIDEVQVSRVARSKDWYKLAYENQRTGGHLLTFKEIVPPTPVDTPTVKAPEDYRQWAYSRKLTLNTTATGADVAQDVEKIPILVRLTKDNFVFEQALIDGNDVRFEDPDGTHLDFSIERWSPLQKAAEIWVKVPKVFGASKADYITMYWGKSAAPNVRNSPVVFDTSEGYLGVWHLNQGAVGKGTIGVYRDATYNSNHGDDLANADPEEGLIGLGQRFGGGADCIRIPSSPSLTPTAQFMVSAWVKSSVFKTDANDADVIIRKGKANPNNYQFYLRQGTLAVVLDGYDGTNPANANSIFDKSAALVVNRWHNVAAIWKGGRVRFFLDGAQTGDFPAAASIGKDENALYIGGREPFPTTGDSTDQFNGLIDEVQFQRQERSAAWIKLSYENQRPDSRLLEFGAVVHSDSGTVAPKIVSDTLLKPGETFVRAGQFRISNSTDLEGNVRVTMGPAADRTELGIADAGETLTLQPSPGTAAMPPVSLEFFAGLAPGVSLFMALPSGNGPGKVRTFGQGIGSWMLTDAGSISWDAIRWLRP
jgi:hypothetical protein